MFWPIQLRTMFMCASRCRRKKGSRRERETRLSMSSMPEAPPRTAMRTPLTRMTSAGCVARSLVSRTAGECSPAAREARDPAERRLANAFVCFVDERFVRECGAGGVDLDAAKLAGGVEQRELVGELADAEAEMTFVGELIVRCEARR